VSIPVPTFVRLEYWNPGQGDWWVGHRGMNLMDPQAYVDGCLENNRNKRAADERKRAKQGDWVKVSPVIIARAVNVETGEVYYPEGADLL
jgi:hypothetical protein